MLQRRVLEQELNPVTGRPSAWDGDHTAIRDQLERILANPLFSHSKRYPALLRWVVERTLDGYSGQLKERTLGVEVFGRHPDYDTNTDPVVRITAGEIRKRIAQYYHEPGHENELRIDLPSGTYVPEFHGPLHPEPVVLLPPLEVPQKPVRGVKLWHLLAPVTLAGVLLALWMVSATPVDRFWGPVWHSADTTLLCIGGAGFADLGAPPAPNTFEVSVTQQIHREYVAFPDTRTLSRLAALFESRGRKYAMKISPSTTFADLRDNATVLIGGFNNAWTMRLLSQLRFTLARDPVTKVQWISDRQNLSNRDWSVDPATPYLKLNEDYAIISRLIDPTTERMEVIAAGVVQYGTIAAGEFLTDPSYLAEISKHAPSNWWRKNLQVVIATKVINGNSGPPRVLIAHVW